jgi:DNA gyrase/topoisomerase IV subunit A
MEKHIKVKLDDPIGLSQAAKEFSINHLALARAAKKGQVRAQQVLGRYWFVERDDVQRYAATYHQRARKRLKNLKAQLAAVDGKAAGKNRGQA